MNISNTINTRLNCNNKNKYKTSSLNFNSVTNLDKFNVSFCGNKENNKKFSLISNCLSKIKEITKFKKPVLINKEYDKALSYFNIKAKKDKDGMLILSHYSQSKDATFKDFGLDEDELFKHVKEIEGYADFYHSNLTSLGNLETIKGDAWFSGSKLTSLDNLQYIGGYANFQNTNIVSLNNLEYIGGDVNIKYSKLAKDNFKNIKTDKRFIY